MNIVKRFYGTVACLSISKIFIKLFVGSSEYCPVIAEYIGLGQEQFETRSLSLSSYWYLALPSDIIISLIHFITVGSERFKISQCHGNVGAGRNLWRS